MRNAKTYLKEQLDSEAQAQLNMLSGSIRNEFTSHTWFFENEYGHKTIIDFTDLVDIEKRYPKWALNKNDDWVLLTKYLWLPLVSSAGFNSYSRRLDGIKLFWFALSEHSFSEVSRKMLPSLLKFFLTHTWYEGDPIKTRSIRSFASFKDTLRLEEWISALYALEVGWISCDIAPSMINKELKTLVPELTNNSVTYSDWARGGNLDLLTLDHGKYYIEHCLEFFERQYPLALALSKTYRAASQIADNLNYSYSTVKHGIPRILQGYSPTDLKQRWPGWSRLTLDNIYTEVTHFFETEYQRAYIESFLLKDETLKLFNIACGVEASNQNINRMKVVLWEWLQRENVIETKDLLSGFESKIAWTVFEKELKTLIEQNTKATCSIPSESDYIALGLNKGRARDPYSSYPRQLMNLVAKAGLINFVALTGWRQSEFGFPSSSIVKTLNRDKLDQYAFPFRYQVDWYVYKTNGKVRLLREITFETLLIAKRIQSLLRASDNEPCLYQFTKSKLQPSESNSSVAADVKSMWRHFVSHYYRFREIDDWNSWTKLNRKCGSGKDLRQKEQNELKRLLSIRSENQWTKFSVESQLQETFQKVRKEWPRVEFFLLKTSGEKEDWLKKYVEGNLLPTWTALLDTHLTDDTKDWLQSLPKDSLNSSLATKTVSKELLEGVIYPNPHSFRHMWAEAVYRRFDGDVGWMIRSQFKHVSRNMWLAYVRDKDNRREHQQVKIHVTNSLVYNFLRNKGEGYSGKFYIRLRRLLKKVSFLPLNEQERLALKFATEEIESIKANGWGYCMVLTKTRSRAKCAESGEPQPHAAEPIMCLGCSHNLMQREQVEWSILNAATHIDVLRSPIVPSNFKEASYQLLKKTTRQVRNFDPDHEALEELEAIQKLYEESRAA